MFIYLYKLKTLLRRLHFATRERALNLGSEEKMVGMYGDVNTSRSSDGHRVSRSIKYCLGNYFQMGKICWKLKVYVLRALRGNVPPHRYTHHSVIEMCKV